MEKLLNRGLNFCITPLKLNLTEILVDWRKFERKMRWREFFADMEISDEEKEKARELLKKEIFKKEKTNLPPLGSKNLRNFLTAAKSELIGTNPNKIRPNITLAEKEALDTLIKLQRESNIVIKPCDKGAGISICNYNDYKNSCEKHLASLTETNEPKYKEIKIDF